MATMPLEPTCKQCARMRRMTFGSSISVMMRIGFIHLADQARPDGPRAEMPRRRKARACGSGAPKKNALWRPFRCPRSAASCRRLGGRRHFDRRRFHQRRLGSLVPADLRDRAISEELCGRLLGWRYSGFSVHNQVRVAADDAEGRKKLAAYMLRAPLSLAKMSYDPASGTVIYRSKMPLGLKRNFQVMPGA